jgi:DNA adenine methylase
MIRRLLPEKINNYYEPFVGGANVIGNLGLSCGYMAANDVLLPLMEFYCNFQLYPNEILEHYAENWRILQRDQQHFYVVRDRFNDTKNCNDFFFLARTSHCGLIRFNQKGEYNSALAHNADGRCRGINPDKLKGIFADWHPILKGVEMWSEDYRAFLNNQEFEPDDFVYFDPPYVSENPTYGYNGFLLSDFADELRRLSDLGIKWMVSYYGKGAPEIDEVAVKKHLLESGQSSFRKLNSDGNTMIHESLYTNYETT